MPTLHRILKRRRARRGNVAVLCAIMMIGLVGLIALAIDIGYLLVVRDQLQRTADASALAAAWELVDADALLRRSDTNQLTTNARTVANRYAELNPVLTKTIAMSQSDVVVGYLTDPTNPASELHTDGYSLPNAVQVFARRTANQNGEVPLFFARALGFDQAGVQAHATAVLINSVAGFHTPADGSNLQLLPMALDEQTWNNLVLYGEGGQDDFKFDADSNKVTRGYDGIREVNLFPGKYGSTAQRGMVELGDNAGGTSDFARQISDGVSPQDMEHFTDSKFELDRAGELTLQGDVGISAAVKGELAEIVGQPRIVPIFRSTTTPGGKTQYTIVQFGGVRVMEVKLTGAHASKRVILQPCNIVVKGGIPSPGRQTSRFVYSPVWLAR